MLAVNLDVGWEFDLIVCLPILILVIVICVVLANLDKSMDGELDG